MTAERWTCARCRGPWAAGAPCCPSCRSTEHVATEEDGMLKINRDGIVSDSADVRESPGTGEPMTGIEHPADGTMSPLVSSDDTVPADAPAPVVEEKAEAEAPPAAPAAPPRTPPRRAAPPGGASG